jgi:hypothetical protein
MEIPGNYAPDSHRSLISSPQCGDSSAGAGVFPNEPNFRTRHLSLCFRPKIDLSLLLCHARVGHSGHSGPRNCPIFRLAGTGSLGGIPQNHPSRPSNWHPLLGRDLL